MLHSLVSNEHKPTFGLLIMFGGWN